jgi:hypothetical protein
MKRSDLLALGVEKDKVDEIMGLHQADVELWKAQKEELTVSNKKIIDDLNAKLAVVPPVDGTDWKAKYDAEVLAHKATKDGYVAEKALGEKKGLAKKVLLDAGIKADILDDFLLGALDYSAIAVKDGTITDADKFVTAQKEKYGKYFGTTTTTGVQTATPPAGFAGTKNPWLKENRNLAEQTRIYRESPQLAAQMMLQAGIKLNN